MLDNCITFKPKKLKEISASIPSEEPLALFVNAPNSFFYRRKGSKLCEKLKAKLGWAKG
jgi:hypothetical protein